MESQLPNYQPLSHSRRSKFEECPRAFSFSYLEKIPQTDNIYAGVGTFVHSVIEDFYNNPKNPNPRNYTGKDPLGCFRNVFDERFAKEGEQLAKLFKNSKVNNNFASIEDWLITLMTNYVNIEKFIHDPKNHGEGSLEFIEKLQFWPSKDEENLSNSDLTMEKKFDITIDGQEGEEIKITGFIDQLIEPEDDMHVSDDQKSLFENIQDVFGLNKQTTTIIDIKTSKPPKNIKNYEDQLNTYAMFIEKDNLSKNITTDKEDIIAGLFFLGGEEEDVKNRIFLLNNIATKEIEEKFQKSSSSIEYLHNEDKSYFSNSATDDVWETKPNILCNWCWYKNLCTFWVSKKNSVIDMEDLKTKLIELRHSGGAKHGPERSVHAKTLETVNLMDTKIENNLKDLIKKIKKLQKQFEFFKKEAEIIDPLHDIKTEIKNFLGLLREESLSNSFSDFIKKESVEFSSEKKEISLVESWDHITTFFNTLKKEDFLKEIETLGHKNQFELLIESGRKEWLNKKSSAVSTTELLTYIETIQEYLVGVDQIKDNSIKYKVKLFDESFLDSLSIGTKKSYPLNEWLAELNILVKELSNSTKLLKRNNLNKTLKEVIDILDILEQLLKSQSNSVSSLLEKI